MLLFPVWKKCELVKAVLSRYHLDVKIVSPKISLSKEMRLRISFSNLINHFISFFFFYLLSFEDVLQFGLIMEFWFLCQRNKRLSAAQILLYFFNFSPKGIVISISLNLNWSRIEFPNPFKALHFSLPQKYNMIF